jgi:hypothetical protein
VLTDAAGAALQRRRGAQLGLVQEAAVDWDGKVDIDLGAEPEVQAATSDRRPARARPRPPSRQGASLADHVQIGFAYQMHLDGEWQKVRLSHVSPGRTFFVFTHGGRHQQTISLTHRMLVRCARRAACAPSRAPT